MVQQLVNKLNNLNCEFITTLVHKVNMENYGLKNCFGDSMSDIDKNPKYQKIKKDFITYYNLFTTEELLEDKCKCDVLKIIKRL